MPEPTSIPLLVVRDLGKTFPDGNGGLEALDSASFSVAPREFVCVLGPSGSGKSTLLRILAGLLEPSCGSFSFVGGRPKIGMVFQQSNLMPWRTTLENITLPLELEGIPPGERRARAQELIDLVGLQSFESSWPRDLSGGMAQRVAIARALVHDPDILLLDEPFGSLDALTRERMWTELARIWQMRRKTVLMVTHQIDEAVLLSDRVIVFSARPAQILADISIPIPRPRQSHIKDSEEFRGLMSRIWSIIEGNANIGGGI